MLANHLWTFVDAKYKEKFRLKNIDKQTAVMRWMWNAHKLPDYLEQYIETTDKQYIQIPAGLRALRDVEDNIPLAPTVVPPLNVTPYDHQEVAVNDLLQRPVWLLHATTGSGKTVMSLMIAYRLQQRTLYIVKDKTLLTQTLAEIKEKMWIIVKYTWGTCTKKYMKTINNDSIEVSTIQSIEKVDTSKFWCIIYDEVHAMLGSDKRREAILKIPCKYQYGLTGTPIINSVDPKVWDLYLGRTVKCDFINMTPDYTQVYTNIELSQSYDALTEFHKIKEELYNNLQRNNLIIATVKDTLNQNKGILFTDRIEHAKYMVEKLQAEWIKTFMLIGEVEQEERERVKKEAKEYTGACMIVGSTQVVWTGFDFPELSRAYLATTTRFKWDLLQYVWRIIRKHPTKPQPIFYDFVDQFVWVLQSQSRDRLKAYKNNFPDGKIKKEISNQKDIWEI